MLYKAQHNRSVDQEDTTLDVTSEKLSPRSHKSPVNTKVQIQRRKRNINMCVKKGYTLYARPSNRDGKGLTTCIYR